MKLLYITRPLIVNLKLIILKKQQQQRQQQQQQQNKQTFSFKRGSTESEKRHIKRLRDYISLTGLSTKFQSAYRPGHSTETALLRVHNDLVQHVEQGNCAMLILLDLSAAFDTIDQGILLFRLSNVFGIHDKALRWIKSSLTNRS